MICSKTQIDSLSKTVVLSMRLRVGDAVDDDAAAVLRLARGVAAASAAAPA